MSEPQDLKTLALRWFHDVWNLHKIETIHELMDPDATGSSEGGVIKGAESFINRVYLPMIVSFPDIGIEIEGAIAEGNDVAVRWKATASHEDSRRFSFEGITWMTFKNGKVIEGWDRFNLHALNTYLTTGETSVTVKELPSPLLA